MMAHDESDFGGLVIEFFLSVSTSHEIASLTFVPCKPEVAIVRKSLLPIR